MTDFLQEGVTQATMSLLADVSTSAVNRYLNSNNLPPLPVSAQRNQRYSVETAARTIRDLSKLPKKIIKKKHGFYNFKGGTGKTSMCFQVASHVALMGYRVLAIDADPQGHLSTSCGFSNDSDFLTLYDCLIENRKLSDVVKNIYPNFDCIPSNLSLTRMEASLNLMPKREERMLLDLAGLEEQYDFIFIDTNPTISFLNRNVINYCDILNIVCETQPYSLNGLKILMEDLRQFFNQMGRKEECDIFIIPNKYEDRAASSAEAMTALREFYRDFLKENFAVRRSEDINSSAKMGKPLAFFAKKNSIAMEDIIELVHSLIVESSVERK
jgi:chromosome partitioning protein